MGQKASVNFGLDQLSEDAEEQTRSTFAGAIKSDRSARVPALLSIDAVTENFFFLSAAVTKQCPAEIPSFLVMNCTDLAATVTTRKVVTTTRSTMEQEMQAAILGEHKTKSPDVREGLLRDAFIGWWTHRTRGFTLLPSEEEEKQAGPGKRYTVPPAADVELFIHYTGTGGYWDYHANFKWNERWYGKWGQSPNVSLVKPEFVGGDVVVMDARMSGEPEARVSYRHVAWLQRPKPRQPIGVISAAAGFDDDASARAIGGVAYDEDEAAAAEEEMFAAATTLDEDHPAMRRNRELLRERRRLRRKLRRVRELVLLAKRAAQSGPKS